MKINDLTIGEVKAIAQLFQNPTENVNTKGLATNELAIVVADRGWVWVGMACHEGDFIEIADARCVRRWGTTQGLAQLATFGPQSDTKLESPSTVRVPVRSVVAVIPCEADKWN